MISSKKPTFVTFVTPMWHTRSLRPNINKNKSFNEWDLLKNAKPYFPAHYQPRIPHPSIGYYDDTLVETCEKQIEIASQYGIDVMTYLFFWNKGRRELEAGLDDAFLKCKNNKVKLSLMWCWKTPRRSFPVSLERTNLYENERRVQTSKEDFLELLKFCAKKYFVEENYWKIDGKPVFFIYTLQGFISSVGIDELSSMIREGDLLMKKMGYEGLFIFGITWNHDFIENAKDIGINALTTYVFLPDFDGEPIQTYDYLVDKRVKEWKQIKKESTVPFYPSVSPGWDGSPRGVFHKNIIAETKSVFPWTPIVTGGTPKKFEYFCKQALDFSENKYLFIASWNEWSEGHYVEPDKKFGYSYLEKIFNLKTTFL